MSHESRLLAIRAQYQPESVGYSRLSFSKALHSAISLPHTCDHSIQLEPPVGEEASSDTIGHECGVHLFQASAPERTEAWVVPSDVTSVAAVQFQTLVPNLNLPGLDRGLVQGSGAAAKLDRWSGPGFGVTLNPAELFRTRSEP